MIDKETTGKFDYEPADAKPRPSVLYEQHLELTRKSRMAVFAGHIMPLWYSSPSQEHHAVRRAAGLFDCTHMGILEVAGPGSTEFLDVVLTNNVRKLGNYKAQYSFVADAAGNILDDIIVYRLADERYMLVVNAANEFKIKAYFNALDNDRILLDLARPDMRLDRSPGIRDMKDTFAGRNCRVDIALQGPAAHAVLSGLMDASAQQQLGGLKPFSLFEAKVAGLDCIISSTGYTGSANGVELYVHPQNAVELWTALLAVGRDVGLAPCGLAARDSLRIEAGLPLYGHELNGKHDISPFEAGYGWAVKLDKPFFIGQQSLKARSEQAGRKVVRVQLPAGKGIRPVRADDAVVNAKGVCIGWITSASAVDSQGMAQAIIEKSYARQSNKIGVYHIARNKTQSSQGRKSAVQIDHEVEPDLIGKIVPRFEKF